jgi:hypothetical protein
LAFEGVDAYLEELVGGSGRNLWGTKAVLGWRQRGSGILQILEDC